MSSKHKKGVYFAGGEAFTPVSRNYLMGGLTMDEYLADGMRKARRVGTSTARPARSGVHRSGPPHKQHSPVTGGCASVGPGGSLGSQPPGPRNTAMGRE
ncbi:MAG TPA: hypothetical protein VNZ53_04175 [Steroidobacteraceae bacterium]|jgi:hypothetical protein|nr:hypothetical protein [Steroidobacteraceae bacterium]